MRRLLGVLKAWMVSSIVLKDSATPGVAWAEGIVLLWLCSSVCLSLV
jgi:hypothetical protein